MTDAKLTEMLQGASTSVSLDRSVSPEALELARLLLDAVMTLRNEETGMARANDEVTSSGALTTPSSATKEPSGRNHDA